MPLVPGKTIRGLFFKKIIEDVVYLFLAYTLCRYSPSEALGKSRKCVNAHEELLSKPDRPW